MNYALDALWWKLTDSAVRDLAALLTAPALWRSGCELDIRTLLGNNGFRFLLNLDAHPQPLHTYLAAHTPYSNRLGYYAEYLLAFWFAHAPHSSLNAHNLPVRNTDGTTLGAADFIATLNGTAYHIELSCKYYGSSSGKPEDMHGLNPQDTLSAKSAKLQHQLTLLHTSDGINTLKQHRLPANLQSVSIIRGIAFFPTGTQAAAPLETHCWHGSFIRNWTEYPLDGNARYAPIDRMSYLAPARIPDSQTRSADEICQTESGLIAQLERRPDGFWHETGRIMKASETHRNTNPV